MTLAAAFIVSAFGKLRLLLLGVVAIKLAFDGAAQLIEDRRGPA